jgi:hypothetical protein
MYKNRLFLTLIFLCHPIFSEANNLSVQKQTTPSVAKNNTPIPHEKSSSRKRQYFVR